MEWRKAQGMFADGWELVRGRVVVGGYHYDSLTSKEDVNKYRITTKLPSFIPKKTHFANEEEAKEYLEAFTNRWFDIYAKEQQK